MLGSAVLMLQHMVWLRLVSFLKLQVSFAEYSHFCRALFQKRPIILRSLLVEATPYMEHLYTFVDSCVAACCSVLLCVAVCCSVLRCVAPCSTVCLQRTWDICIHVYLHGATPNICTHVYLHEASVHMYIYMVRNICIHVHLPGATICVAPPEV